MIPSLLQQNFKKFSGFTNICNVVFFDSNLNSLTDEAETLDWCRSFNGLQHLNVFKLVCEDTVEDSLSIRALQQKIVNNHEMGTNNICKIKKHALDALFNLGGNGILTNKTVSLNFLKLIISRRNSSNFVQYCLFLFKFV